MPASLRSYLGYWASDCPFITSTPVIAAGQITSLQRWVDSCRKVVHDQGDISLGSAHLTVGPAAIVANVSSYVQSGWTVLSVLSGVTERADRLCGLVVRVLDYRSGGPGSVPGDTTFSEK
jgi:hypothetical protein